MRNISLKQQRICSRSKQPLDLKVEGTECFRHHKIGLEELLSSIEEVEEEEEEEEGEEEERGGGEEGEENEKKMKKRNKMKLQD